MPDKATLSKHYHRMIPDCLSYLGDDNSEAIVIQRLYAMPIVFSFDVVVDRLGYIIGAVSAGNVRMAIYRDNGDTPIGGVLIVETASVAAGGANNKQEITIVDTSLQRGLYWLAWQASDVTHCFRRPDWFARVGGTLTGYLGAFAYAAFPNPFPAIGVSGSVPSMYVRVREAL